MSKSTVQSAVLPLIAYRRTPNVGKSTLFNRLTGSRRRFVGDEPGITRDRLYGLGGMAGARISSGRYGRDCSRRYEFIPSEIFRQARVAFDEASAIVMVVDARTEIAGPDRELARLLLRTGSRFFLQSIKSIPANRMNEAAIFIDWAFKMCF